MIRGIYTSASGMLAESIRTDAISNNLANVNTTGYKRDVTVNKDFASLLMERINDGPVTPIGKMGVGTLVDEIATVHDQGAFKTTGNPLDFVIKGEGYFVVQTPNGERYTRSGALQRSAQGDLVTADGYRVLGQNSQPINVGNAGRVDLSSEGIIRIDQPGQREMLEIGQLQIVDFADHKQLQKEGNSLFKATENAQRRQSNATVEQSALEMANTNAVTEMIHLIAAFRSYEINSKAVQSHDNLMGRAVNDLGKIG